ncbi:MAG TPA: hypothetical protein VKM55_05390 [Candidatus Lokiarchaeia archaeon]|nr:hypothetical protein [Candidatus Lokiarchaeia archaeon]
MTKKKATQKQQDLESASSMTKVNGTSASNGNDLDMTATETVEIDWNTTCEKCLGKMVKRRLVSDEGPIVVMQCVRCRYFKAIPV